MRRVASFVCFFLDVGCSVVLIDRARSAFNNQMLYFENILFRCSVISVAYYEPTRRLVSVHPVEMLHKMASSGVGI